MTLLGRLIGLLTTVLPLGGAGLNSGSDLDLWSVAMEWVDVGESMPLAEQWVATDPADDFPLSMPLFFTEEEIEGGGGSGSSAAKIVAVSADPIEVVLPHLLPPATLFPQQHLRPLSATSRNILYQVFLI